MAFAIAAAHAPSLGGLFDAVLVPRMEESVVPMLQTRQNSTTSSNSTVSNTVNMFIDAADSRYKYAASIVSACNNETVYALQCTDGGAYVSSITCGPKAYIATLTLGPSVYEWSSDATTTALSTPITASVQETCKLVGTTAATCTATAHATIASATTTSRTTTETLAGTRYFRFDVEITGGAEKTINPTATCVARGAASGFNTKNVLTWALAGVVGVLSMQTVF